MKHIIALIFLFILLSCSGRSGMQCNESGGGGDTDSVSIDLRCQKIQDSAMAKGKEAGFCHSGGGVMSASEREKLHPDREKCNALWDEANRKCATLPPAGPGDIDVLSGSATYHKGKKVSQDGKPICP